MQRILSATGEMVEIGEALSFYPHGADTSPPAAGVSLIVTASIQQITLPTIPAGGATMRIVVSGTSPIAFAFGAVTGLTMQNGVVMLPGTVETFYVPPGTQKLSLIGAASGSTIYVNVGDGQ